MKIHRGFPTINRILSADLRQPGHMRIVKNSSATLLLAT